MISLSTIWEAESKNLPIVPSPKSSNSKSPEPDPVIVPLSNSTWISTLPVSGAKPPLTTETSASAVPELKVNISPSSYPVPAASTITSETPAPEISKTCILPPAPSPPPIRVASSPTVKVLPSLSTVAVASPLLTVTFTWILGSTLLTPETTAPVKKVPTTVSSLIEISIICVVPSWNFKTFSTIALAKLISELAGLFACSIVWPTNSIGSWTVCASVCVQRINVSVDHLPSDTLSISSVGV